MKPIIRKDDLNVLTLMIAYWPAFHPINKIKPSAMAQYVGQDTLESSDAGAAWIMTAQARKVLKGFGARCGEPQLASEISIETWISGVEGLHPFVEAKRMLVHRSPRRYKDREIPNVWEWIYAQRRELIITLSDPQDTAKIRRNAGEFLEDMLESYRGGTDIVRSGLKSSPLHWCYSDGRRFD